MAVVDDFNNEVWARLAQPHQKISFADFAHQWHSTDISVKIFGYGGLAEAPGLLSMLRGAIGRVLMMGASRQSLDQNPCPWSPPCANDVFYGPKPELKITRHTQAIPKPFVLSARAQGQYLILSVSLFGFAQDWQAEMRSALICAIRERLDWPKLAGGLFVPTEMECAVQVKTVKIAHQERVPKCTFMEFQTPVDCKNTDPIDNPSSIVSRLSHRLFLLARWYDLDIAVDWKELSNAWRAIDFKVESDKKHLIARNSKRTKTQYKVPGRRMQLCLEGDLKPLWPLLIMGEQSHVGRGTTSGLGRYVLKTCFA